MGPLVTLVTLGPLFDFFYTVITGLEFIFRYARWASFKTVGVLPTEKSESMGPNSGTCSGVEEGGAAGVVESVDTQHASRDESVVKFIGGVSFSAEKMSKAVRALGIKIVDECYASEVEIGQLDRLASSISTSLISHVMSNEFIALII